jgi:hypothetical protein
MIRSTLVALAIALVPAVTLAQAPPAPPVIVTQGEATLKRAPDRAWISVSTETRERLADDARRRGAEAMTAVRRALRSADIPADAIRTTGYSLAPELDWNNGRSTVRGYLVRNQIEVRVDDLDNLSDVIDAANASRNTSISVSGPRFDLKNSEAVEREALQMAVQAAMTRAAAIAAGARRTLGAIVRIEDQPMGRPQPPMPFAMRGATASMDAVAVETPITPGEIEIRALVSLTVELR